MCSVSLKMFMTICLDDVIDTKKALHLSYANDVVTCLSQNTFKIILQKY